MSQYIDQLATQGVQQAEARPLKEQGMVVTMLSQFLPGEYGQQIETGFSGFKDVFNKMTSGFGGGHSGGFSLGGMGEGIGKFFQEMMQKLSDFMHGSSSIMTMGNDANKLTQDFAQITGANPRVTEMSQSGVERDLGRAQDMALEAARNAAMKPTDPTLAQSGIKTPGGPGGMA